MIRVGAIGDPHITRGPRLQRTRDVLRWAVAELQEAQPDIIVVTGDVHGTHDTPHVAHVEERAESEALALELADIARTFWLLGNHDEPGDFAQFQNLDPKGQRLHVVTQLEARRVAIEQRGRVLELALMLVPYQQKRQLLEDPTLETIRQGNESASDVLRAWIRDTVAASTQHRSDVLPFAPRLPWFLFGHVNVRGAVTSGDEVMAFKEVELDPADLEPFDLALFGHIHRHQQLTPRAYMVGTLLSQTHGEQDAKGLCLFDYDEQTGAVELHRILSPAVRMVTLDARWTEAGWEGPAALEQPDLAGCEVRLRLSIPEGAVAVADSTALVERLRAAGAEDVVVKPTVEAVHAVRSEAIATATGPHDKLEAWWEATSATLEEGDRERLHRRLDTLLEDIAHEA